MKLVESPMASLIAKPTVDWEEISQYLERVGGENWLERISYQEMGPDAEALVEFAGRGCYRSWDPGLNPNVTKVREDSEEYLANILSTKHGSVLEHAQFTFILEDVSRVFTHELVRHRAGTAISQESMRYVRLDDIPFWFPYWAREDQELIDRSKDLLHLMEEHQIWMADHFGLDDEGVPFSEKKHKTSFMRRFAPDGVATFMVWSANVRTLRFVLELRTALGAEEEIRLVLDQIGEIMVEECPALFQDFKRGEDGTWESEAWKA